MATHDPVRTRARSFLTVCVLVSLTIGTVLVGTTAHAAMRLSSQMPTAAPPVELQQPGHLQICSDIPSPPQEFYDANGNLVGSDIDTGNEIARRLKLTPVWVNSVFDTIIEAVNTGKCDIIISGQNITLDRLKQVDMIPYFSAGQTFVVLKGNPDHVSAHYTSLCGKKLAVQTGTTELQTAQTYSAKCTKAHKGAIAIIGATKSSDALQQVQTGHAVAFFQDSPVASYYVKQQPTIFQTAGGVIAPINEGISVPKDKKHLEAAIKSALRRMEADGTYQRILKKWSEQNITIPPIS